MEILFWISALLAEVVGTMAGFGSSTIFLPVTLFFYDFRTALVLVAIFHMSGNIGRIAFFRHGFDKKMLLRFGLPSVVLTLAGALLVQYISQPLLKFILGIFLIIYVILFLWKPQLKAKPGIRNSLIGGGLSGFFAGLIGTGGALRGAFLSSFNLEKSVYISTAAAISLAVDITRIPVYFSSGFLPREMLIYIPFLFLVAIAGSFIGKKIVNKIPQKIFRKIVLICIGLVSIKFIYDGIAFWLSQHR
ncbi:MAG: sulfite exporter TauE/SafE family protein [Candidatus Marinimicrobia bacterium]|jgi:uncharacterized membrane protein YfcA|nr:sulfite exporter TauE/SafE family protein [Candidatus Neomarinimicrobiota bacterium]MDD4962026.1 sulfite exporter TauE/SafE family protein [Candidatus Neomarinimicrobiota bacterium]MDD5709575.1 sulfite exporter TauE/SafE family protein [Candidatus Neomarinimicrobiota bacterium]MDX9777815.1 sulfite exporter TauE/SafE family protein [bacterium]